MNEKEALNKRKRAWCQILWNWSKRMSTFYYIFYVVDWDERIKKQSGRTCAESSKFEKPSWGYCEKVQSKRGWSGWYMRVWTNISSTCKIVGREQSHSRGSWWDCRWNSLWKFRKISLSAWEDFGVFESRWQNLKLIPDR